MNSLHYATPVCCSAAPLYFGAPFLLFENENAAPIKACLYFSHYYSQCFASQSGINNAT